MAALVLHARKDGESQSMLFISPTLTVARARWLHKSGWQVHVSDGDGRVFRLEEFDELLQIYQVAPARYKH